MCLPDCNSEVPFTRQAETTPTVLRPSVVETLPTSPFHLFTIMTLLQTEVHPPKTVSLIGSTTKPFPGQHQEFLLCGGSVYHTGYTLAHTRADMAICLHFCETARFHRVGLSFPLLCSPKCVLHWQKTPSEFTRTQKIEEETSWAAPKCPRWGNEFLIKC